MSQTNNEAENDAEIVSAINLLKNFKLPKTIIVKCQYCGAKRDQSNMARHYKSDECTWTPEEGNRRKMLLKLEKKKEALRKQYEARLATLKAKFKSKISKVDEEIQLHS